MKKQLLVLACILCLQPSWAQTPACYDAVGLYQSPLEFQYGSSCLTSFYSSTGCDQFKPPTYSMPNYNFVVHYSNVGTKDQNVKFYNTTPGQIHLMYMGATYYLTEFHFHSPSEHTFKGHDATPFQMEMHMVFRPMADTLNTTPGVVIGIPILEGTPRDVTFNTSLEGLLRNQLTNGQRLTVPSSLFTSCLNYNNSWNFPPSIMYSGSLTTYPYGQGYTWIVINGFVAQTAVIRQPTLNLFQNIKIGGKPIGHARGPQKLNTRPLISLNPQ